MQSSAKGRSSCSSTSCTPSSARARRRARWTPPTCSSRCWPAASCTASARPRWTSTASTSRRTRRWSGASSRCVVEPPASRTRSASCAACSERYEVHHGVRIKDSRPGGGGGALRPLYRGPLPAGQGHRPGRRGGAALRMEIDSMPVELDEVERRILQLEIEREALRKEKDAAVARSGWRAGARAGRPQGAARSSTRRMGAGEAAHRAASASSKEQMERSGPQIEAAPSASTSYERGRASCSTASCRELERQLEAAAERQARPAAARLLKEEVDEEDIAEVVARWTGIPVARMMEGEVQKLLQMEERLHQRVIGQDEAIEAVVERGPPRAGGPAGPEPAARLASSSSARPASARRSWRGPWPSSCSTTSRRWSAST